MGHRQDRTDEPARCGGRGATRKVARAIDALRDGRSVVILDDVGQWGGVLAYLADGISAASMGDMVRATSGLVAAALSSERLDELQLPMMVSARRDERSLPFALTVDVREGTTTGISASDRAATVRALVDDRVHGSDLARPGHVIPIRCDEDGVLGRPMTWDAAFDLSCLAGRAPGAAVASPVDDRGAVLAHEDLARFATETERPAVTVSEVIEYRLANESVVRRSIDEPYDQGSSIRFVAFESLRDEALHVAVVGDLSEPGSTVYLHRECVAGHLLAAPICDCRETTAAALGRVISSEHGALIVLRGDLGQGHDHARVGRRTAGDNGVSEVVSRLLAGAVPSWIIRDLTDQPVRVSGDAEMVDDLEALDPEVPVVRRHPMRRG